MSCLKETFDQETALAVLPMSNELGPGAKCQSPMTVAPVRASPVGRHPLLIHQEAHFLLRAPLLVLVRLERQRRLECSALWLCRLQSWRQHGPCMSSLEVSCHSCDEALGIHSGRAVGTGAQGFSMCDNTSLHAYLYLCLYCCQTPGFAALALDPSPWTLQYRRGRPASPPLLQARPVRLSLAGMLRLKMGRSAPLCLAATTSWTSPHRCCLPAPAQIESQAHSAKITLVRRHTCHAFT